MGLRRLRGSNHGRDSTRVARMDDLGRRGPWRGNGLGGGSPRRPGNPAGDGGRRRRRHLFARPRPAGPRRPLAWARADRGAALRLGDLRDRGARLRERDPRDPRLEPHRRRGEITHRWKWRRGSPPPPAYSRKFRRSGDSNQAAFLAYSTIPWKSTTTTFSFPTTQASCPDGRRDTSPGLHTSSVPSSITTFSVPAT